MYPELLAFIFNTSHGVLGLIMLVLDIVGHLQSTWVASVGDSSRSLDCLDPSVQ